MMTSRSRARRIRAAATKRKLWSLSITTQCKSQPPSDALSSDLLLNMAYLLVQIHWWICCSYFHFSSDLPNDNSEECLSQEEVINHDEDAAAGCNSEAETVQRMILHSVDEQDLGLEVPKDEDQGCDFERPRYLTWAPGSKADFIKAASRSQHELEEDAAMILQRFVRSRLLSTGPVSFAGSGGYSMLEEASQGGIVHWLEQSTPTSYR